MHYLPAMPKLAFSPLYGQFHERLHERFNGRMQWVVQFTIALFLISWIDASPACAQLQHPTELSREELSPSELDFFEKKVRPLLIERCYECHSAEEVSGGLRLDSKVGVAAGGDSGAVLVAGKPDESRLMQAVRYADRELQMPPSGKLSEAEIEVLSRWIEMGVPDPREVEPARGVSPTGMSIEAGREFWSLRPVANPSLPEVKDSNWASTPIDRFVLAELDAKGLGPAAAADRRTIIRRVTFDLTGLPPTTEEVEAFVADEAEDAYAKLVDRLLASPQYGVRWGRHWLDVARYADSNGLDENLALGNAWRYRDYVIDAFNANKPFDRFLIEQLAGDLVSGADRDTITATGFLVLGAKVLAEPDREKLVMDTLDEQIDATGKAFLGLTLGCSRCHDHKFDPIKQKDYYALAAIFKSTRTFGPTNTGAIKHWNEHSFATAAEREQLKSVEAEIAAKNAAANKFKGEAVAKLRAKAREQAADYLAAAALLKPSATLKEVATVASPLGLHPRILHHCRLHLEYHRDDKLFEAWHQLVAKVAVESSKCEESEELVLERVSAEIGDFYRKLFAEAEQAWAEAKKAKADTKSLADERLEGARVALNDASGFLAIPPQPEFAFDAATFAEYDRLMEEARLVESKAPDETAAMGVADGVVLASLPLHIRGSHRNLGDPVTRDFPLVMRATEADTVLPRHQSGRLELAEWMASTQHPLTARVFVNRLWRWHFGRGLVASTENFGALGDRPSHPALLDFLARHFMASGWSVKELQRMLVLSSTYQMQSAHADEGKCASVDPENLLLWKFRMQRLEAEQIRDAVLAVSGRLDVAIGGKTVPLRNRQFVFNHTSVDHTRYESLRRAAFLPVIRNNLYTLFEQFDFPDPTMPTGDRAATVVAPQALLMMNDELVMDAADAFAERLLSVSNDDAQRLKAAYGAAVGREPTEAEELRAKEFIAKLKLTLAERGEEAERAAWAVFCHSLMASNEFIYVR